MLWPVFREMHILLTPTDNMKPIVLDMVHDIMNKNAVIMNFIYKCMTRRLKECK